MSFRTMHKSVENLEVEVKFHINRPESMHHRLVSLGAIVKPKVFEINQRLEDDGNTLKADDKLLRLRQDNTCKLTYKCKASNAVSECKVFQELEVVVSDFDTMRGILHELGYHTAQIYEKWRQTFHWNDVELCIDTMPFGTFIEIEGAEEKIRSTAHKLQLPWEKRILENYLAMFEVLRNKDNLDFQDVTFANFENLQIDIIPLLEHFEAGASRDA